jgi:hypothetical protein
LSLLLFGVRVNGQGGYDTVDPALNKTVTVSAQFPTVSGSAASITNGKFILPTRGPPAIAL